MEYLVTMTTRVPEGVPSSQVERVRERESAHPRELAPTGPAAAWRPPLNPVEWRTLGLFDARSDADLDEVLTGMPLRIWRTDPVIPLAPHPIDPGRDPPRAIRLQRH